MDGFQDFAVNLYNDIRQNTDSGENIFLSPFSIYTALSMVYAGSRGKTAEQIKESIKTEHNSTQNDVYVGIQKVWNDIASSNKELTLNLANNFWVQNNFQIKNEYKNCLKEYFEASPTSADFVNNFEKIRNEINHWVESKTNNKIKDLIPQGALNPLTRLVLVNAIYFYGQWLNAFLERSTTKRDFFISKENSKKIDMMYQQNDYRYFEDKNLNIKAISLPYKGSSSSMVIVLPNEIDGIKKVEDHIFSLEQKNLDNILTNVHSSRPVKVKVYLPKFKFEHSVELKKHLMSLGINDLFSTNDADLTGIAESNELYVSDAFHKAFVEVNEKGTEAAAATDIFIAYEIVEMHGFQRFALALYDDIRQNTDSGENIFLSPFSIYTALSMVYAGSRGKTADEIKECMKTEYAFNETGVYEAIKKLWNDMEASNKGLMLNLANNFWVQNDFEIKDEYKSCLNEYFDASPTLADFVNNFEKTRNEINQWVESKTNNKIKDLIPQGALDSLIKFVLVNAIYFYGNWKNPFSERYTEKDDFFITKNKSVKVDMMYKENKYRCFEGRNLKSKIISLPYKDSTTSMVIILPDKIDGLKKVEEKLVNVKKKYLEEALAKLYSLSPRKVELSLPKFTFEHSVNLKQHLISLGIKDLFTEKVADLTGIADSDKLFVSDAFHKAFIEVNEKGTEAAAATGMIMRDSAVDAEKEIIFNADHPFIFLIHDEKSDLILFMGKVASF